MHDRTLVLRASRNHSSCDSGPRRTSERREDGAAQHVEGAPVILDPCHRLARQLPRAERGLGRPQRAWTAGLRKSWVAASRRRFLIERNSILHRSAR